jgi:hypothetical protein
MFLGVFWCSALSVWQFGNDEMFPASAWDNSLMDIATSTTQAVDEFAKQSGYQITATAILLRLTAPPALPLTVVLAFITTYFVLLIVFEKILGVKFETFFGMICFCGKKEEDEDDTTVDTSHFSVYEHVEELPPSCIAKKLMSINQVIYNYDPGNEYNKLYRDLAKVIRANNTLTAEQMAELQDMMSDGKGELVGNLTSMESLDEEFDMETLAKKFVAEKGHARFRRPSAISKSSVMEARRESLGIPQPSRRGSRRSSIASSMELPYHHDGDARRSNRSSSMRKVSPM